MNLQNLSATSFHFQLFSLWMSSLYVCVSAHHELKIVFDQICLVAGCNIIYNNIHQNMSSLPFPPGLDKYAIHDEGLTGMFRMLIQ